MDWIAILILVGGGAAFLAFKRFGTISQAEACRRLREGAMVVDVRSPGEFLSGHLPEAINLPLDQIQHDIARRVPDKGQVLLLHCLSGVRSGMGRRILKRMGYGNVFNLGSYRRAESIVGTERNRAS